MCIRDSGDPVYVCVFVHRFASLISCSLTSGGQIGDLLLETYLPKYLANATQRMNAFAPKDFTFTINDTYAMQSICAYESNYIGLGMSAFCDLFTLDEWLGFQTTLSTEYYYDYAYGNPTGRAQGIGYLQELMARLDHQYINASDSSVNSTLDDNAATFPLNELFYADFSHDGKLPVTEHRSEQILYGTLPD